MDIPNEVQKRKLMGKQGDKQVTLKQSIYLKPRQDYIDSNFFQF